MYPVSTSIHLTFDRSYLNPFDRGITRIVKAGFRFIDFNFLDQSNSLYSPFVGDEWEKWIDLAGNTAAKLGATFNQAHAPVHNGIRYEGLTREGIVEHMKRAIQGCATLGIPWMVFHALYDKDVAGNHEFFDPIVDYAKKYGVGVAFENTWIVLQNSPLWSTEGLIELCDSYKDPLVGICWDTGHCNVYGGKPELKKYTNQYTEITKLGKRLKATHIDDNFGVIDDHICPFEGTIVWEDVMRALRDIGYEHSFTYEAHNAVRRIPTLINRANNDRSAPDCEGWDNSLMESVVDEKMKYMAQLGEAMVRYGEQ